MADRVSRRFKLLRDVDVSGVSGVGHVADGVVFPDGTTVVRCRLMAAAAVVYISVEPVDYQFGGWCRRCLLPSGVRVTAMVTIGPSSHLRTFDRCTDCHGSQVDPPEA